MNGWSIVRTSQGKSTSHENICYSGRMSTPTTILAFYAFAPIDEQRLQTLRSELFEFGVKNDMRGLVLLATEGINGTVCGSPEVMCEWKKRIDELFADTMWNESSAEAHVFPRWLIKVREEIVALNKPNSSRLTKTHLTPSEWNAMMESEDAVVIDTRNTYETEIGMFEGAIDPLMTNFKEFSSYAASCDVPKEKKVMLYCTGGIRCEKAVAAMKDAGYRDVFQLEGGILSYLKEFPEAKFKGECFVFDHRVAVDGHLKPSTTYGLCTTCGDPGTLRLSCAHCKASFVMCTDCQTSGASITCSKNCRYHFTRLVTTNTCATHVE